MPINMFDTREMLIPFEENLSPKTFLRDRYFSPNVKNFESEVVDIDVFKGKRRLAPFVSRKIGGKMVERIGFTGNTFKPPVVAPFMETSAEDLLKRSIGEDVYQPKSPEERASEQLTKDFMTLDEMITRREEAMCAEAIFKGRVTVTGEGIGTQVVQYWPTVVADQPYQALGSGDRFNEDTADPTAVFKGGRQKVMQKTGITPVDAILGSDVVDSLLNQTKFVKQMDTRKIDLGMIDPTLLPGGVTYLGYHKLAGLDLWSYDEWYYDEVAEEEVPMVPVKEIVLASPFNRTTMAYATILVQDEQGNIRSFPLPRVPDSWSLKKPQVGRNVRVSSAPLPIVNQVDGFYVIKALA